MELELWLRKSLIFFPELNCIVLDLPHVIVGLEFNNKHLSFVRGDMFKAIPPADAVLVKIKIILFRKKQQTHI